MHNYRRLKLWVESIEFATKMYRLTESFLPTEQFGLISQIRRSAVSIPSNIAEGAGRNSDISFAYFISIANGSTCELETQLTISSQLDYIKESELKIRLNKIDEFQKIIYTLIQKFR